MDAKRANSILIVIYIGNKISKLSIKRQQEEVKKTILLQKKTSFSCSNPLAVSVS